ncbi:MAG: hypothetical protein ACFFCZ_18920 [Promethearchaeota archaeon]
MFFRKIISLLVLTVLFGSFLGFSVGITVSAAIPSLSVTVEGTKAAPPTPSPELPHNILPVSILVYTQYTDTSPTGEWAHTMTAINNTYGTNYYYANLTDYTQLATELPKHDILLIPDQEKENSTVMKPIGAAWASILPDFVDNGGIVILLDWGNFTISPSFADYGSGSHIYNESGLMQINGAQDATFGTVNLVNTSDALARGVAGSWSASDGSISFDTSDGTTVVDDGTDPVVVHKIMGKGHVVLLGFDLWSTNPNYEQILGNAIRLHRHVVFDDSHGQDYEITTEYGSYAEDLVAEGFAVSSMDSFSPALLDACDVLVMGYSSSDYSNAELDVIESFVAEGGGLFLIGELGGYNDEIEPVAHRFGYDFENDSYLSDSNDYTVNTYWPVYDGTNLHNHSLTLDVSSIEFYAGTGIISMPENAVSIITTDDDGSATWAGSTAADGVTCYAASTYEMGRIVVATDSNFLTNGTDADSDATENYYDSDNDVLAVNTIRWLSAAGLKERVVLFDESHGPWFNVNGAYLEFAKLLTSNGYTIKWMSTFYQDFLDMAHVLFIIDGTTNHTASEITAIKNFVGAGGGLALIGDDGARRDTVDKIANEFGMDFNNTAGDLIDTDDYIGGTGYIVFDGANIESHPITQGVSRIEWDYGTALISIGSGTALVTADGDGTSDWTGGYPADGVVPLAVTTYQLGRVFVAGDVQLFDTSNGDGDGFGMLYEHDNVLLTVNAFQWLVENHAPIVEVATPNGGEELSGTSSITWTATDPNKDDVTIDLSYSTNGGSSWTSIASGLPNNGSISWDTSSFPDSDQYLIRVEATDHELTGQDDSDADFQVDNNGPTITNVKNGPAAPTAANVVNVSANVEDISGVKSVALYYTINGGAEQSIAMSNVAGTLYAVDFPTNFAVSDVVEYYIKAVDNNDFATSSSTKSFTVAAPPGIPGFELPIVTLGLLASLGIIFVVRRKRQ